MPDPNLPVLAIEEDTLNTLKTDMVLQGMAGPPMPSGEIWFGWSGIKQRLKNTLGVPIEVTLKDKKWDEMERDIDTLMMVDAGRTVGWDGIAEPGAVAFFEQAVGNNGSSDASTQSIQSRSPRVVLNWYVTLPVCRDCI